MRTWQGKKEENLLSKAVQRSAGSAVDTGRFGSDAEYRSGVLEQLLGQTDVTALHTALQLVDKFKLNGPALCARHLEKLFRNPDVDVATLAAHIKVWLSRFMRIAYCGSRGFGVVGARGGGNCGTGDGITRLTRGLFRQEVRGRLGQGNTDVEECLARIESALDGRDTERLRLLHELWASVGAPVESDAHSSRARVMEMAGTHLPGLDTRQLLSPETDLQALLVCLTLASTDATAPLACPCPSPVYFV